MRQAIGWSFALRNIRRMEAEEAEQALLKSTGAESVRDVKVTLCPGRHLLRLRWTCKRVPCRDLVVMTCRHLNLQGATWSAGTYASHVGLSLAPKGALQIRLKTLRRRARLLFLPAYVADYNFGESFNAHGERRPQRFQAVVSGMDPTSIAAERHYSPHKVCSFRKYY